MQMIMKNTYFFTGLGVFALINFAFMYATGMMKEFPVPFLPLLNRKFWLANGDRRRAARVMMQNWFYAIASALNFTVIVILWKLLLENHRDGQMDYGIDFLFQVALGLLAVAFVLPLIRTAIPKENFMSSGEGGKI
jgi:hypothetical protein